MSYRWVERNWGPDERWTWYVGLSKSWWRIGVQLGDEFEIALGPLRAGVWFH